MSAREKNPKTGQKGRDEMVWKCDQKLWKTKDGKIVTDGDSRAAVLFATPGMELESKPEVDGKVAKKPAENKAVKPAENKAVELTEDK